MISENKFGMKEGFRNSHIKIFINGSIISLIGILLFGVLNFIIRRELALTLTSKDFGFFYSAISLCMIFLSYLDLGLEQSATILLSKSVSEESLNKPTIFYTIFLTVKFLSSLFIFLILAITYKFWLTYFFKSDNVIPYFAIITILIPGAIVSAPYAVLAAFKKFTQINIFRLLGPLIILAVLLVIKINNEILIPAIIFPLSAFIVLVVLLFVMARLDFVFNLAYLKNTEAIKFVFHLSKWVTISTAGLSTMYYFDSLMLTYFRTLEEVALYNVALPIIQIAQSLMVISVVFTPIVSEMWKRNKTEEISNICNIVTELIIYLMWPIIFTAILASKYIIIILFSGKFVGASNALIILFVGNIFYIITNFYMATLNGGFNAKSVAYSIITGNLVNVILNVALVPAFGINGAAIATTLSYFSITIFLYFTMKFKLPKFGLSFNNELFVSIIGILGIIVSYFLHNSSIFPVIITILIINAFYFSMTFMKLKQYFLTFIYYTKTTNIL